MQLSWIFEGNAVWDEDKQRVIGGAPPGALDVAYAVGASLPGDWWAAVDESQEVVGYGWLDATWGGDAEILLAVDAGRRHAGAGGFILEHLEQEAAGRGLNYVYNTVRTTHPDHDAVHDWLAIRGYRGGTDDAALRKRVRVAEIPEPGGTAPARSLSGQGMVPPGHEESGGYVNVEDHQY